MNYLKIIAAGRLVRDPSLKYTPSGKAVCSFGIAVNRKRGDAEEATFLDCEAWEKTAELIDKHLSKGDPIFIEGSLKQDRWETKDGQKRSKLVCNVFNFQFIGPPKHAEKGEPDEHSNDTKSDGFEVVPF